MSCPPKDIKEVLQDRKESKVLSKEEKIFMFLSSVEMKAYAFFC